MLPGTFALMHCPITMPRHRCVVAAWKSLLTGTGIGLALLFAARPLFAQGIDHAPFDALLHANVKNGVVNYPGFQNSAAFKQYVESLSKPVKLETKADQIAYYTNAYNAFAIQGILDGLSPTSLFGRVRYFRTNEWPLNGRHITLYDIEHKVLRPLGDPRIHFAIICASKSCPFLRTEVYSASKLDAQLDDQAKQFINDPFRNRFDKATKTAHLSEIFKWFDEDFSRPAGSAQKYIAKYVGDQDAAKGLAAGAYVTEWISYDWTLNGTPPK